MSLRSCLSTAVALGSFALVMSPSEARAGIEACGNIDVRADAKCQVMVKGGCTAQCEPIKFEVACAAKLEVGCQGQCNVSASVACTGTCGGACNAQCSADPPKFDCKAACQADCSATCNGKCSANANRSECDASCRASCSGRCDAECRVVPPSANCEAKCGGCCQGSCKAQVNADCNINCQARGFASCKSELSGGCKVQCEKPEGALFCDGNYVDVGNNLKNCLDALNAILNIKVSASGSAECTGEGCTAQGKASISACSTAPPERQALGAGGLVFGLGALAFLGRRRKRA